MKTFSLTTFAMLAIMALSGVAQASSPAIDSISVQGYLAQPGGTQPVTSGSYTFVMGVEQNGTLIWGKHYASVNVSNGLFSITLGGAGENLNSFATPCPIYSGQDFHLVTLNSQLLTTNSAGLGEITVHVCGVNIMSNNPNFDVTLGAAPTAMVADIANGVVPGSVGLAGLNVSAVTDIFHAGTVDSNKIVTLPVAGGQIDPSLIPPINIGTGVSGGTLGLANGGTGSASGSITGTGSITYQSASGSTTTIGNGSAGFASATVVQSGTGGISENVVGNSGNIAFTAGANTGNIVMTPGTVSGTVTVGSSGSSGATTFGNSGGAAATNVVSGTTGILLNPSGVGQVRVMNGNGLNIVNGGGSITVNSPVAPTSYNFVLPSTGGTSGAFLQTTFAGSTATTNWVAVDLSNSTNVQNVLPIANGGSGNGSLPVTNGGVVYTDGFKLNNAGVGTSGQYLTSQGGGGAPVWTSLSTLNPTGALTIGGAATTSTFMGGAAITMDPAGTVTVGVSPTTTGVSINPGGAVQINPTSGGVAISPGGGGVTMNPTGVLQLGGVNTSSATLSPSGFVTINPTGNLTLGGASTVVSGPLVLNGSAAGSVTLNSAATVATPYSVTFPGAQGAANSVLVNNGTGTLTWETASAFGIAGSGNNTDINSLNPTGGLALGGAATTNISVSPGSSGTITVGDASTGAATFGNTGNGSVGTFEGGSGAGGQALLTSNGTGVNAVSLSAAGSGGSVAISANTTGNIVLTQGTANGVLTLGSNTSNGGATLQGAGPVLVTSSDVATGAVTVSTTGGGSSSTLVTSNGTGAGAVTVSATGSNSSSAINLVTGAGTGGGITVSPDTIVGGQIVIGNSSIGNSTFGNTGLASLTTLQSGTGGLTMAVSGTTGNIIMTPGTTSGSLSIGSPSTGAAFFGNSGAGAVTTIGSAGGSTSTNILAGSGGLILGNTGLQTLNLGASATGALSTTLGSTASSSTTTIQAGSGGLVLGTTGLQTLNLGASATGALSTTLGSSTSSSVTTIQAGSGGLVLGTTGLQTLNLGGNATGALTTTLGSSAGASVTNIKAGTGGINFTGTVNLSSSTLTLPATTTTFAAPGRNWYIQADPTGNAVGSVVSVGFPTAAAISGTANGYANADTAVGPFLQIATGATDGNVSSIGPANANSAVRLPWGSIYTTRFSTTGTPGDMQNVRYLMGLSGYFANNTTTCGAGVCASGAGGALGLACKGVGGTGTLKAQDVAMFEYAHGTTSDANVDFMCVTCNSTGSACTATDSNVSVNIAAATMYDLEIDTSGTSVVFKINGNTVCTNTTNLPLATTGMAPIVHYCTAAAVAKKLNFNRMNLTNF